MVERRDGDDDMKCTKCGATKTPGEFPTRISGRSASWCRECTKEYARGYAKKRRSDPEFLAKERAAQKIYSKTEAGIAARKAYQLPPESKAKQAEYRRTYLVEYSKRPDVIEREKNRARGRAKNRSEVSGAADRRRRKESLLAIGLKECVKCGTTKPLGEFGLQKRKTGSFPTSWCRVCLNEKSKLFMRKHVEDPEVRARMNENDKRRYHEVYKLDPEHVAMERVRAKEYSVRPEVKVRQRAYREEYIERPGKREALAKRGAAWVKANPERARAYGREYAKTPKCKVRNKYQIAKRRAVMHGNVNDLTKEQIARVFEVWGDKCAYCGGAANSLDHVHPVMRGGANTMQNVVPACRSCNSRKGARLPIKRATLRLIREMVARY